MVEYAKSSLLRYRWARQAAGLQELVCIIKADPDWHKSEAYKALVQSLRPLIPDAKLVERDLRGAPLSGADLFRANLSEADLLKATLFGAQLQEANLVRTNLSGADLSKARLRGTNLSGANLWGANLSGTDLWEANLSGASLWEADLSEAILWDANLSGAQLQKANLSGANLWGANLSGTDLSDVSYTTDEIFNRLIKWWMPQILSHIPFVTRLNRTQKWRPVGITNFDGIDTTKINGSRNPVLKRHIGDYQFILGLKRKSWFHRWILYPLWKVSSDCGRSLLLWLIWSVGLAGLFATVYAHHLHWFKQVNINWFSVLYFSVVTFTTLGFGNVDSKIDNPTAQVWVMAEVVIGYLMLGGLISILFNKWARRA